MDLLDIGGAGFMHDHCDWIARVQSSAYHEWTAVQ